MAVMADGRHRHPFATGGAPLSLSRLARAFCLLSPPAFIISPGLASAICVKICVGKLVDTGVYGGY